MNYKKAAEKKRLAGVLNHTHSDLTGEDTTLNPAIPRRDDGLSSKIGLKFQKQKRKNNLFR